LTARVLYDRFGRFEISEASMTPALRPGDFVLTDRSPRPLYRGDIAVFEHPSRPSFFLVKRIVGLPGDRLTIDSGRVLIDGTPLDEPWTTDETGPDGVWELGPDEAFVLGDARWMSSGDSREIGPVPLSQLSMQIVFRYWPVGRIGPVR
jgi:signal peptidase I